MAALSYDSEYCQVKPDWTIWKNVIAFGEILTISFWISLQKEDNLFTLKS